MDIKLEQQILVQAHVLISASEATMTNFEHKSEGNLLLLQSLVAIIDSVSGNNNYEDPRQEEPSFWPSTTGEVRAMPGEADRPLNRELEFRSTPAQS